MGQGSIRGGNETGLAATVMGNVGGGAKSNGKPQIWRDGRARLKINLV